ncbi:MAG: YfjP family GTPase [Actinomycetota bacterium]|nr:YfjP family GTPase [Actinomycetota bacterium]
MKKLRARKRKVDVDARLAALKEAVEVAEGRLPEADVALGRDVLERAGARLGLGASLTVVALAGSTGSGKSSLFNALSGAELSAPGVRRPTTGETHSCSWGDDDSSALLDWLQVSRRHHNEDDGTLEGLVLLDLPDHDSTELDHRLEVDRLVELVDLLVWVLDPQKYADGALHERYLRPLAGHSGVTLIVLNQIDRLDEAAQKACVKDLKRLLKEDGLQKVSVVTTSALTGEGLDDLRAALAQRVSARRAAADRLVADVLLVCGWLGSACDDKAAPGSVDGGDRDRLAATLSDAANVPLVAGAVERAYLHRAKLATGWPLTRWIKKLRPDPLARLHLSGARDTTDRTSLPATTPVQRARVSSALRSVSDAAAGGLPPPWPSVVRRAASANEDELHDQLDRAVSSADLHSEKKPGWWSLVAFLQGLLVLCALAGALWLVALFVIAWLQLPDPPTYEFREIPVPTLLLLGGLLAGALTAAVAYRFARVGAARRKRAASRSLSDNIAGVARAHVIAPVERELDAYRMLCDALNRARGEG